jgi:hypothetical protein
MQNSLITTSSYPNFKKKIFKVQGSKQRKGGNGGKLPRTARDPFPAKNPSPKTHRHSTPSSAHQSFVLVFRQPTRAFQAQTQTQIKVSRK